MHKEIHKVINQLVKSKKCNSIVVYTNATIIPKGENLNCLKHPKVVIDMSNYGDLSRNFNKLKKIFQSESIQYTSKIPVWTDSGRLLPYQNRSKNELRDLFFNCCNNFYQKQNYKELFLKQHILIMD